MKKTLKIFMGSILAFASISAYAGMSASVTCGPASAGGMPYYTGVGTKPVINITYSTGPDAGTPGLIWIAMSTPDQQAGWAMPFSTGQWEPLQQGGLYPPLGIHADGLPAQLSFELPIPSSNEYSMDTGAVVGYQLGIGHGVLNSGAQNKVSERRNFLNGIREDLIKRGKWSSEYDSDDQFKWALVQKDAMDSGKYAIGLVIPYVNCRPPFHLNDIVPNRP
jgi:hypothetical protein